MNTLESKGQRNFWTQDVQPSRKFFPVSSSKMRELGVPKDGFLTIVDNLEDLRDGIPNIVIAKPAKDMKIVQNYFKEQKLKKNVSYVMGLGVYQQLHKGTDERTRKTKTLFKPSKVKFTSLYNPYMGEDLSGKTLLVFRTGGIGDLLFIQPNLLYLKEKYPDCTINFACGPQYQAMVDNWECVDNVLDLPFPVSWLTQADYHALFEGVIERCTEAHTTNAYHLFTKWLNLNLPNRLLVPKQGVKEEKLDVCKDVVTKWGLKNKRFILMQLRASSPIRTPSPDFWVRLVNMLTKRGWNVVLTDNPRQSSNVDSFIKLVEKPDMVFNFCKYSISLDYTIAVTSLASATIATDSALNHIAASLDIPNYGIYGPFPGHIRLLTYPKAKWVDAPSDCAPCFIHGHKPCEKAGPDGFSPCYDNIDLNKVVSEVEELID